jgi:hypothetical protein
MNERIRELVGQAVSAIDIVTGNEALDDELAKMYIPDCFAEKFAELIVKACADKCLEMAYVNPGPQHYAAMLKEHFGVEE